MLKKITRRNYMLKRNHNLVTEVYIHCILINFAIFPYRKTVAYPIYVIRNSIYFTKKFCTYCPFNDILTFEVK